MTSRKLRWFGLVTTHGGLAKDGLTSRSEKLQRKRNTKDKLDGQCDRDGLHWRDHHCPEHRRMTDYAWCALSTRKLRNWWSCWWMLFTFRMMIIEILGTEYVRGSILFNQGCNLFVVRYLSVIFGRYQNSTLTAYLQGLPNYSSSYLRPACGTTKSLFRTSS